MAEGRSATNDDGATAGVLALEGRRNKAQGERTRDPWGPNRDSYIVRRYCPRVREYAHPGLYYDALPGLRRGANPHSTVKPSKKSAKSFCSLTTAACFSVCCACSFSICVSCASNFAR